MNHIGRVWGCDLDAYGLLTGYFEHGTGLLSP